MGAAGGIAIAGVNMWALLLDKDPGHSAAAGDLAVDVVDQKLKKAAAVTGVAKVEKAPPASTVAKPAKRVNKQARKNKKSASVDSKQQAADAHDGKVQMNGDAAGSKQTATPADDLEVISVRLTEMLSRVEAHDTEAKEENFEVVTARGSRRRRTVAAPARARKAAPVQEDVATGGANMWALLLDKDPGHSAAASDLAVDVVDQKLKKAAAVTGVAKVEKAPPAATIAKPAKRVIKQASKNKKSASVDSKQQAANVHDGKVQINGAAGGSKQTATPATVPELSDDLEEISVRLTEMLSREEAQDTEAKQEIFQVVTARGGRRRTVAARARKAAPAQEDVATGGANMWALLLDKDPGHSAAAGDLAVDVLDQKLKKAAAVVQVAKPAKRGQMVKGKKGVAGDDTKAAAPNGAEADKQTAPPAATMDGSSKVQIDGAGGDKQVQVPDGDELTHGGLEEIKESKEEEAEEEEPREEMFKVVAARGGGRRTRKAAVVAEGTTVVTDTNMWALLSDNDPGHGAAKPAKRGKRTKTKKKKNAEATMDNEDEALAGELEEEMTLAGELEEEEEEMTDEAVTSGGRCGRVVSRVCKAAMVVAMLALYFQLA